jgi:hypothetical protein
MRSVWWLGAAALVLVTGIAIAMWPGAPDGALPAPIALTGPAAPTSEEPADLVVVPWPSVDLTADPPSGDGISGDEPAGTTSTSEPSRTTPDDEDDDDDDDDGDDDWDDGQDDDDDDD